MEAMLKRGAAACRLGVTVKPLGRWDRSGLFAPLMRSPTGLHLYSESQLATRLELPPPTAVRRVVAYCWVSGPPRNRTCNQRLVIEEFVSHAHWLAS